MNEIKIDPSPAVSRYHQQHRFFISKNSPNLGDHDLPNPGYMIVCFGYQSLVGKENVCEDEEYWATDLNDIHDDEALTNIDLDIPQRLEGQNTFDRLGRKYYQRFSSEPVRMVLRAVKFSPSTAQTRTNDLLPLRTAQVKDGKGIASLNVDNRPDWNLLSVLTRFTFVGFGGILNLTFWEYAVTQLVIRHIITLNTPGV